MSAQYWLCLEVRNMNLATQFLYLLVPNIFLREALHTPSPSSSLPFHITSRAGPLAGHHIFEKDRHTPSYCLTSPTQFLLSQKTLLSQLQLSFASMLFVERESFIGNLSSFQIWRKNKEQCWKFSDWDFHFHLKLIIKQTLCQTRFEKFTISSV